MIDNNDKEVVLERVLCIYYPVRFQGGQKQVGALLDSDIAW